MVFLTVILVSLVLSTQSTSTEVPHDFHVSKTSVHYNNTNQSLEVTLHIFIDDLELAMIAQGMERTFIATAEEHMQADELIHRYLQSVFSVKVNGQPVSFSFLGKEESEDLIAIWCYLEGKDIDEPNEVLIQNSVLTDIYDDQKNMVSFTSDSVRRFFLMDHRVQEAHIKL